MEFKKTQRGFTYFEFKDSNDVECTLQKSSSAMTDKIWLGVNDADPQIMASKTPQGGTGWVKYPFPEDVSFKTRMHLNIEQVKELIPILQRFIETGEVSED